MHQRIAETSSARWIQGNHCFPLPIGPPTNALKGGNICCSAPPRAESTIPVRRKTDLPGARAASASQAVTTPARKSRPGAALSSSASSPPAERAADSSLPISPLAPAIATRMTERCPSDSGGSSAPEIDAGPDHPDRLRQHDEAEAVRVHPYLSGRQRRDRQHAGGDA